MKLLILASGKGSRLNKLTKKPKCLVNVLNKPIISYYHHLTYLHK